MTLLSIIIPVYNEEKYLEKYLKEQIKQLRTLKATFQIIVSENGSKDKTLEIAKTLAKNRPYIQILHSDFANYGLAVKNGFLKANGKYLVLFDLDYWDISFLEKALKLMNHFDAIVGAKRGDDAQDTRPLIRRVVTCTFSLILKLLFGMKISDTHGIKILNRKKFIPLIHSCISTKEIFDSELLIRGEYENLQIGEIGVSVTEKRRSRTSIAKRAYKTIKDLFVLKIVMNMQYA